MLPELQDILEANAGQFRTHYVRSGSTLLGFFIGAIMESEVWKYVPGFGGMYQVSNHGRLKSFKRLLEGYVLSNVNKTGGYFSIVLNYMGEIRYCRLNRLVAEAFIPNPENKPEVNHKDSDKQNTFVWNLEWATKSENVKHAIKHAPSMIRGMTNYNQNVRPKTILQIGSNGNVLAEFKNSKEAEKSTGVCHRNILQVASQDEYKPGLTRSQAGGFGWEYKI